MAEDLLTKGFQRIMMLPIDKLIDQEIGDIPNYSIFDGHEGQLRLQAVLRNLATELWDLRLLADKQQAEIANLRHELKKQDD